MYPFLRFHAKNTVFPNNVLVSAAIFFFLRLSHQQRSFITKSLETLATCALEYHQHFKIETREMQCGVDTGSLSK